MMKQNSTFRIWGTLTIMAGLSMAGCSSSFHKDSMMEKNWGRSFETQLHAQIVNPDAALELEPSEGVDGKTAGLIMDKYRKSFSSESKDETVNIIKLK